MARDLTSGIDKLEKFSKSLVSLAIGVVVITISNLYMQNGMLKTSFILFPQTAVYLLLGLFHAYNIWMLEKKINELCHGVRQDFFTFICYTIMFAAWYNAVLFPASGIGFFEWIFVFIVLTTNFINEAAGKPVFTPFMGLTPQSLLIFGVALFLVKEFVFFLFPDNIYDGLLLQASTLKVPIVIFAVLGLVMLCSMLLKNITNKMGVEIPKGKSKKFTAFVTKLGKDFVGLLSSLLSFPVVVIICASLVLVGGIFSAVIVNKIYTDILSVIEPLLEKALSTGENTITPSNFYNLLQTLSIIIVAIYSVFMQERMKDSIKSGINREIRTITDRPQYIENGNKIFKQVSARIQNCGLEEALRILNCNSVIENAVVEVEDDIKS